MHRTRILPPAVAGFVFLFSVAVRAETPPAFPDTPPGRLMAEWVQLFNDADPQKLAAFIEAHYGPAVLRGRQPPQIANGQLQIREGSGKLALTAVEKSSPTELVAIFKSGGVLPQFIRAAWQLDERDPQRLSASTIAPTEAPASEAVGKVPLPELTKDLEAKLEQLTRRDQFSGTAMIAKDGVPVWEKAYGLADRELNIPVTLDTRFRIGSMNKMFTSVAIAQLVEAGKLTFNDTIAKVLPDYPNKEVAEKITIHQLLTHTSGLGDIFTSKYDELKDSIRDLRDYLPLFVSDPLQFQPGEKMSYSNAGFVVLGLIVEKVSGQSYFDYVQQHIYEKAGMMGSGDVPKTEQPSELAIGYQKRDGKLQPNWETLPRRASSAGGGYSTVSDLVKFATALHTQKLLLKEFTDTITTGKAESVPGRPGKYAYGFEDGRVAGERVVGHGGGAPGMNGQLSILWDGGYTVAVLANLDPPSAENVAKYILPRLP